MKKLVKNKKNNEKLKKKTSQIRKGCRERLGLQDVSFYV